MTGPKACRSISHAAKHSLRGFGEMGKTICFLKSAQVAGRTPVRPYTMCYPKLESDQDSSQGLWHQSGPRGPDLALLTTATPILS